MTATELADELRELVEKFGVELRVRCKGGDVVGVERVVKERKEGKSIEYYEIVVI